VNYWLKPKKQLSVEHIIQHYTTKWQRQHFARMSYEWRVANDVGNQELRMSSFSDYF